MINNVMKLHEVLLESPTDIVARFYKEASSNSEKFYNPEIVKYKEKNEQYYKDYLNEWFDDGVVSVFEKPVNKVQPPFTNDPKEGKIQSPGYRGLQYALAAAGLPYNHSVQRYEPNISKMLTSQTMDNVKNNS